MENYRIDSKGRRAKVEQYDSETMVLTTLSSSAVINSQQEQMLRDMNRYPITYDEDCPELSPSLIEAITKIANQRRSTV